MASPPDPLRTVLPKATRIVIAEVLSVENRNDGVPRGTSGVVGGPMKVASQRVVLKVTRVLRGAPADQLTVEKPVGAYALRVGNHGPFLLDDASAPNILGRYGPDSYRLQDIEQALQGA